jgi:hypothetical protein
LEQDSNRADKRKLLLLCKKILEQNSTELIDGNDFSCVKRVPQPDATKPLRLQSKRLEGTAQITIYGKQRRNKLSTGTANLTQDFKY